MIKPVYGLQLKQQLWIAHMLRSAGGMFVFVLEMDLWLSPLALNLPNQEQAFASNFRFIGSYLTHDRPTRPLSKVKA